MNHLQPSGLIRRYRSWLRDRYGWSCTQCQSQGLGHKTNTAALDDLRSHLAAHASLAAYIDAEDPLADWREATLKSRVQP